MEPAPVYETAERVSQYDPTAPQYNPTSPVYLHSTSPKYSPTTPESSVCDTPRCGHAPEDAPASLEEDVCAAFRSMTSKKVVDLIHAERKKARLEGIIAMFHGRMRFDVVRDVLALAWQIRDFDVKQFEELYIDHVTNDWIWVQAHLNCGSQIAAARREVCEIKGIMMREGVL
ncbi:hypothetical protein WJX84_002384 [Apatococcus fuscideae]|uniref:Uncharacterized protein n=1 Tax=Apatococcus fuscideae TaxID=2026836 RepID=A0AAW1T6L7_9CHLO